MNEIVHPKGKLYYSMGEVCEIFNVKPSLIRFWEDNFSVLKPHRNNKGNRLFTPADVDNIGLIYNLVKERGMTLAGAEKRIRQDKKGGNKLNRNVEIIQYLQKIRNLLREVKDDIDNDESVIATFDDDVFAEPQENVEELAAVPSVHVDEARVHADSVDAESKNVQNVPELQKTTLQDESAESKSGAAVEMEKKTDDAVPKKVAPLSTDQKKLKRKGVTKTPHKTKVTIVEPRLDLFSMFDVVEEQQPSGLDVQENVSEKSAGTESEVYKTAYTEVLEDVEIEVGEQSGNDEKPTDVALHPEKIEKREALEVVQTPQDNSENEAETSDKPQRNDEPSTVEQDRKQITQIFF